MVPHLEVGDHKEGVVPFRCRDPFMHLCWHLRVVRHLGVLKDRVRARTVPNNDLQGKAITMGFYGPHNSSQD